MNMDKTSNKYLTMEQVNHLKELGVVFKNTAMAWYRSPLIPNAGWGLNTNDWTEEEFEQYTNILPAPMLQEVLEMLPEVIEYKEKKSSDSFLTTYVLLMKKDQIRYDDAFGKTLHEESRKSLLNCAYEILCWCAGNGYLETK